MKQNNSPISTILIPHYQTPDSIKLCLRSIRKYESTSCIVRVLDNGSKDSSIAYLRKLSWIELIETGIENDTWTSHFNSLNMAVHNITTPYFMIMHSDTYIHHSGLLEFLISLLNKKNAACIGPNRQTIPGPCGLSVYRRIRGLYTRKYGAGVPRIRSLCTLYKTDVFKTVNAEFYTSRKREDITYKANAMLVSANQRIVALSEVAMGRFIFHKGDTTQITNKTFAHNRTKHDNAHTCFMARREIQQIMADDTLDR